MYIVMTSSAKMPSSCRGRYNNVAVVEVDPTASPKMISTHARGVRRIVQHYGPQSRGTTERCAYARTVREAEALAASLNFAEENA